MARRSWAPGSGDDLSSLPVIGTVPDARAWFVLGMLCFVYVLNFLDRQLLSILAKPIQDTLHITDGQLGLIGGLYFALFYCFIAIPVGWVADKTNRVRVLSLACAIWSGATMACGLRRQLSAACDRAHDGRLRRSGRRSAFLCDRFGLFPARPPRHRARHLQSRSAYRCGAGHRLRRLDRRRVQLARCLHRSRSRGLCCGDRRSAHGARAGARRSRRRCRHSPARRASGRRW